MNRFFWSFPNFDLQCLPPPSTDKDRKIGYVYLRVGTPRQKPDRFVQRLLVTEFYPQGARVHIRYWSTVVVLSLIPCTATHFF